MVATTTADRVSARGIKLWGRSSAFNVQKVLWLLDELGLEFEHIHAGGRYGGLDHPDFLAMNPHGRVPVLQSADGTIVWESHSILRYLAQLHGSDLLWPAAAGPRSQIDRWMDWSLSQLQPTLIDGFLGLCRTPEELRDMERINSSAKQCGILFQVLDRVLANQQFVVGDDFTLADIPAGSCLYRYYELGIARPSMPHVEAWYRRLQTRASFCRHVMVPFMVPP